MENKINTGSVVVLKSSGPKMTVGKLMPNGLWKCSWFVGNELREGEFHLEQLKLS